MEGYRLRRVNWPQADGSVVVKWALSYWLLLDVQKRPKKMLIYALQVEYKENMPQQNAIRYYEKRGQTQIMRFLCTSYR